MSFPSFIPGQRAQGLRRSGVWLRYVKVGRNTYIIQREQQKDSEFWKKKCSLTRLTWQSYYSRHLWTSTKMIEGEGSGGAWVLSWVFPHWAEGCFKKKKCSVKKKNTWKWSVKDHCVSLWRRALFWTISKPNEVRALSDKAFVWGLLNTYRQVQPFRPPHNPHPCRAPSKCVRFSGLTRLVRKRAGCLGIGERCTSAKVGQKHSAQCNGDMAFVAL